MYTGRQPENTHLHALYMSDGTDSIIYRDCNDELLRDRMDQDTISEKKKIYGENDRWKKII